MTVYQIYATTLVPLVIFDEENALLISDFDNDFTSYLEDEVDSITINGECIQVTIKTNTKQ